MSKDIKYTDSFGTEITFQQAGQMERYHETIIEDGQKRVNTYTNGSLLATTYYVSSQGEMDQLLSMDPNACFNLKLNLARGYTISESLCYENRLLAGYKKFISDPSDNLICLQEYFPSSGSLVTEKWYHDNDGDIVYAFIYNRDGSCFSIEQFQINDPGSAIMANKIGIDPDITFTWSGFEYYQNAEPLIPN
ncbi:MAG: hypothetical protein JST50_03025 [Bacteroidetes bacterium]|jgi:hypothetical protein|nr:hypothetical protein [Bacteroidota bacterium]